MQKDDIIEMLLRAKVYIFLSASTVVKQLYCSITLLDSNFVPDQISMGGSVSSLSLTEKPKEHSRNIVEPTAIPAPAYNFLGYNIPTSRSVSNIPTAGNNVGLGISAPVAAQSTVQNWGGSNSWSDNNAARVTTPQQQPPANKWLAQPPAQPPQQQPMTNQWPAQPQPVADTWALQQQTSPAAPPSFQQPNTNDPRATTAAGSRPLPPYPAPPPSQQGTDSSVLRPAPAHPSTHKFHPQYMQAQQQQSPAIAPIQFGPVQTYTPGGAGPRLVSSPNAGWIAAQQTAQGSNASERGGGGGAWGGSVVGGGSAGGAGAGGGGGGGGGGAWGGSVVGGGSTRGGGWGGSVAGGAEAQPGGGW
jgi:hypothetical protein